MWTQTGFSSHDRKAGVRRAAFAITLAATAALASPAFFALNAQTPAPAAATPSSVGVNLNITPKRLTFNRNTRSATVYIFNQGTTEATFDVSVGDSVMLPSGDIRNAVELQKLPEGPALLAKLKSAKDLVRATPRRATLAPGKGQTIRILVTHPEGASGEYRTHLTVTTLPPRDAGVTVDQAASQKPNEISFRIQTVFGISIPLIVRPTPVEVQTTIQNPQLTYLNVSRDGVAPPTRTAVVTFDLLRAGTGSAFGNIEIRSAGAKEPIGIARGVGVYPEIDRRPVRVPLDRLPKPGERLDITFTDDDLKPGTVAAKSALTVA